MKIAFLLYPTRGVRVDEDSSFWIMRELQKRGHRVSHFESRDLNMTERGPAAHLKTARLDPRHGYLPSVRPLKAQLLDALDVIFIRKEPPFRTGYLHALQMLDAVKSRVFVLNDPAGIAMANEKMFTLLFPALVPETLVTERPDQAVRFILKLGKRVIVKPLDDKGGAGIFALKPSDRDLTSLLEIATRRGRKPVLVQRFLDADRHGDKRIVILNGRILGAFLRRPSRQDLRANLSTGGTMHKTRLTGRDKAIVEALAPELDARGLYFTGIDVIGNYLTEVNVTSPAGVPELRALYGLRIERQVADFIESRRS